MGKGELKSNLVSMKGMRNGWFRMDDAQGILVTGKKTLTIGWDRILDKRRD
jgi:hypothetical protein